MNKKPIAKLLSLSMVLSMPLSTCYADDPLPSSSSEDDSSPTAASSSSSIPQCSSDISVPFSFSKYSMPASSSSESEGDSSLTPALPSFEQMSKSLTFDEKHELMKFLLHNGPMADINRNRWGESLVRHAVFEYNVTVLKVLIRLGSNVNISIGGTTPLIDATMMNRYDLAKILIEAGADVNLPNDANYTALMIAAERNYIGIAQLLLNAGAKLDLKSDHQKTALDLANEHKNYEIASLIRTTQEEIASRRQ